MQHINTEDEYNIVGWTYNFAGGIDHKSSKSTSQAIKKIPPFVLMADVWIFIILLAKHSFLWSWDLLVWF